MTDLIKEKVEELIARQNPLWQIKYADVYRLGVELGYDLAKLESEKDRDLEKIKEGK